MIKMGKIEKSMEIFKALGDLTRLKIISCIFNEEKSVNMISRDINLSQSAISHQLRLLREVDIVRYKQNGKERLYYLSDDHVKTIIDQVFRHTEDCGENE
jgi:ArsR family transcriptional regulator